MACSRRASKPSMMGMPASTAPWTMTGLSLPNTRALGAMPLCSRS
ncbi:Uncharacterised protein [Bordetella pertussis]|nr:Uncharacterised protein [Bordetella pertussis]